VVRIDSPLPRRTQRFFQFLIDDDLDSLANPCRMSRNSQAGSRYERHEGCSLVPPDPIRVSVIVPVYNAEHTVARAIDSVLRQQFDRWELIAIDDGSTDSSFAVLQAYHDCIGNDRIKIGRQRNSGAAAARNAGARLAVGEYLAFLDADDEWLPNKLQACIEALDASPNAVLAYSDMKGVDGKSFMPMIGSPSLDHLLSQPFALFPSAAVVRREAFEGCGGFSEQFASKDLGEDTFMGLRLRELGEFVHVAQPLAVYHGSCPSTVVLKYPRGHRTFTRLAKERYGKRSMGVRTHVRQYYCSVLLTAALDGLREHVFFPALVNLVRAATASPGFVLHCVFNKAKNALHG
jgi:glycosyltransferase involved in cell wall biosynthesis